MKLLKKIARRIMRDEIAANERHIDRLEKFAKQHLPEIVADGTDQAKNIQAHLDVLGAAKIPAGNVHSGHALFLGEGDKVYGDGMNKTVIYPTISGQEDWGGGVIIENNGEPFSVDACLVEGCGK